MSAAGERILDPVTVPDPLLLLVTAAATASWYDIEDASTRTRVASQWHDVIRGWVSRPGVRIVATFDDDLLLSGDPRPFSRWSIFVLLEVPRLEDAVAIVDSTRQGELRLSRYFTISATLGRGFWPADDIAEEVRRSA